MSLEEPQSHRQDLPPDADAFDIYTQDLCAKPHPLKHTDSRGTRADVRKDIVGWVHKVAEENNSCPRPIQGGEVSYAYFLPRVVSRSKHLGYLL